VAGSGATVRLTLRAKLMIIVGATALAFVLVILVSTLIGLREARQLANIEGQLVPKLALGPDLEGQFQRLRRNMQDAVAAQDAEALSETRSSRDLLLGALAAARDVIDPVQMANVRGAIEDYFEEALGVSRRLVKGETGEDLVTAMAAMQAKHARAAFLLKQATRLDRSELAEGFAAARAASQTAAQLRLAISVACLVLVLVLSIGIGRGVLQNLTRLSVGLARFGQGDFTHLLSVTSHDEIGKVAREANQMAENLGRLAAERDRSDWLKTGQAKLANELRGELEPREIAQRTIRLLASYVDAPAGALYVVDAQDDQLRLAGQYALSQQPSAGEGAAAGEAAPGFRRGEGLVGQAALQEEIMVIEEPPPDYLRIRSGLGDASARAIVLLPLLHVGRVTGVVELALFKPCSDSIRELCTSIRETLSIALEVARARATSRELLAETRRQAQRLSAQEQELSASNEELQSQQGELKQANEELEEQRRALQERNAELEGSRRREQQKAEALADASAYKSQFLANMSHELRTPLNSMLLLSNLLGDNADGNLTDKQVEFCNTIHSAGKDLLALINQVLDLAKIESGKQEVQIEAVTLADVAARARKVFAPMAADKGLALTIEVEAGLPEAIATDRQRIDQILTNLIGNAIKFTERGGVSLHIRRPAPATRIERSDLPVERAIAMVVSDTGIGIAPEEQERVFAPFQQLDARTDRRYGGTGLGLTIARELTALLGGELQLDSARGRGSTFTCFLPIDTPASKAAAAGGAGARAIADDRATIGTDDAHLLIIEDDASFAEQLADIIHIRGFKVQIAAGGREGLRLAREHRPKGIILDVKLPDMDGWTVMERLRDNADTRAIPVHFISSLDAPERGLAMGAVGYLTKPASRQDLFGVVETLAPQAVGRSRQILVVEDDTAHGESLVARLESEGLKARHVQSGNAALEALQKESFGCIVLDLGLPDMDGLGFLELMRGRTDIETPPVVVYTGRALTKEETHRIEAYAEAVVLKEGRSTERLIEEIRMFIEHLRDRLPRGRGRLSGPTRLHAADIHLDGKKIMVVDDDMRTVYALSALLSAKSVEVLVADTGRAALDLLAQRPDLNGVLMDVMMPEMDGYEAMRRLRQDARFAKLPVIALTAKAMKGEREKCIEAGASDYLTKPVDPEQLLAMLQTWLTKGPSDGS
jgi:CheY-like chemotaxis protein